MVIASALLFINSQVHVSALPRDTFAYGTFGH